jgi:hypothetical protein
MPSPRPSGASVSRRDTMRAPWEDAGLELIESRVIRIPVVYSDFNDFWDWNSVPVGPQGKAIHENVGSGPGATSSPGPGTTACRFWRTHRL